MTGGEKQNSEARSQKKRKSVDAVLRPFILDSVFCLLLLIMGE
jgi:hypothetical protein